MRLGGTARHSGREKGEIPGMEKCYQLTYVEAILSLLKTSDVTIVSSLFTRDVSNAAS